MSENSLLYIQKVLDYQKNTKKRAGFILFCECGPFCFISGIFDNLQEVQNKLTDEITFDKNLGQKNTYLIKYI